MSQSGDCKAAAMVRPKEPFPPVITACCFSVRMSIRECAERSHTTSGNAFDQWFHSCSRNPSLHRSYPRAQAALGLSSNPCQGPRKPHPRTSLLPVAPPNLPHPLHLFRHLLPQARRSPPHRPRTSETASLSRPAWPTAPRSPSWSRSDRMMVAVGFNPRFTACHHERSH